MAEPSVRDIFTDELPKASFREIPLPSKYSPVLSMKNIVTAISTSTGKTKSITFPFSLCFKSSSSIMPFILEVSSISNFAIGPMSKLTIEKKNTEKIAIKA